MIKILNYNCTDDDKKKIKRERDYREGKWSPWNWIGPWFCLLKQI